MKKNQVLELEYHFTIPRSYLKVPPLRTILGLKLISKKKIEITDFLLETKETSLKSIDAGIRIRKVDNELEFTYKKFFGKEKGAAKFDERTNKLNKEKYRRILKNDFSKLNDLVLILKKLNRKMEDVYTLMTIRNTRTVLEYLDSNFKIEVVVENILYKSNNQEVVDAMLEIEIKSNLTNYARITDLVNKIKHFYQGTEINEGKNTRGMRLLNIAYA